MKCSDGPMILIVDNDELLVRALSTRLSAHGYNCVTAVSGAQAMSLFNNHDIQLVISDLSMPAGDGVTLATQIRRISKVPIIFVTGFRDAYRRVMRAVPDVTMLEKPFSAATLLALVDSSIAIRSA